MKIVLATIFLALAFWTASVQSDDDQYVARHAVERGELLPLSKILAVAERDYPGKVLEVELDRENGRYVYEIEVLLENGHVIELTYDGQNGTLIESEIEDD